MFFSWLFPRKAPEPLTGPTGLRSIPAPAEGMLFICRAAICEENYRASRVCLHLQIQEGPDTGDMVFASIFTLQDLRRLGIPDEVSLLQSACFGKRFIGDIEHRSLDGYTSIFVPAKSLRPLP